ncbi:hypothetical protein T265_06818 [Opisthorchis viverrini]|uniref:Homeobox domain-containing protein n=1 Tax=Opisthorchis viverrini TaxID=6198 RepID=A0A074ZR21_OPIVI|nr:hypothetical protein T265_06818 [Opisthorchis viverrini]KER25785.1 hypothetical protein T265_06818 [Opisthorchis viverrini]
MDALTPPQLSEKIDANRMEMSSPKFSIAFAAENLAQSQPSTPSSVHTSPRSSASREAVFERSPLRPKYEKNQKYFPPRTPNTDRKSLPVNRELAEKNDRPSSDGVRGTHSSTTLDIGNDTSCPTHPQFTQNALQPSHFSANAISEAVPGCSPPRLTPQLHPNVFAPPLSGVPMSLGMDARSTLAALSAAYTSLIRGSTVNTTDRITSNILHAKRPPSRPPFPIAHMNFQPPTVSPLTQKSGLDWPPTNMTNQEALPNAVGNLLSENLDSWQQFQQAAYANNLDPHLLALCGGTGCAFELSGNSRRKNATRETTSMLKAWLNEHRKNPYPTKGEKIMLAIVTKMSLTQVSTWFANARRRLKKESKITWGVRTTAPDSDPDEDSNIDDDDTMDAGELEQLSRITNRTFVRNTHAGEKRTITESGLKAPAFVKHKSFGNNVSVTSEEHQGINLSSCFSGQINEEPPFKRHLKETKLESGSDSECRFRNLNNGPAPQNKIWSLVDLAHDRRAYVSEGKSTNVTSPIDNTLHPWLNHHFTPERWLAALGCDRSSEAIQWVSTGSHGNGSYPTSQKTKTDGNHVSVTRLGRKQGLDESPNIRDSAPKLPHDPHSHATIRDNPFLSPSALAAFYLYMQQNHSLLHSHTGSDSIHHYPNPRQKNELSSDPGDPLRTESEVATEKYRSPDQTNTRTATVKRDSQWPIPTAAHQTSSSVK